MEWTNGDSHAAWGHRVRGCLHLPYKLYPVLMGVARGYCSQGMADAAGCGGLRVWLPWLYPDAPRD